MKTESIKVSIVTVCRNSEKTIQKTIQSVKNQSYSNIEYIIVDGKSTDNTVEIIKAAEPEFEGRMRWISEPDGGIYDAMNKGIGMATGDLVGIINSDDFYEVNAVSDIVSSMTEDKYQILYGFMRTLKDGKERSIEFYSHEFLENGMICHPTCFVTKKLYDDYGAFDLKYISVADYDFLLRMKRTQEVVFVPVYKLIANFTAGGMCSTHAAYLDLLKFQRDYGKITPHFYRKAKFKAQLAYKFQKKFCKK